MRLNSPAAVGEQTTVNYRQRIKKRFKQEIAQIVSKHALTQLVIVLDQKSAFLLSNIFATTELVAMKIMYIERLEVKRKKLDRHAVYFINPTKDNIQFLVRDFPVLAEQQTPQYRKIHILFTTFIEKSLLKALAVKGLLKRLAKNSLKQFYFSARVLAPNLVDINLPYLGLAFSRDSEQQGYRRELICKKIIEFLANFETINTVRIYYKKSANKVCQRLANTLQQTVKNYLGILLQNRSTNLNKSAPDLTILLLDRSVDTVTPFIHYFTYQSLLFDLFPISMVTKTSLKDKGAFSYEQIQNQLYDSYRYKHISVPLKELPEALEDEKGKLELLKGSGHQNINVKELTERVGLIKDNIEKLQAIWKEFQDQKIEDLADLEQSLATGTTSEGEETKSVKLLADVGVLLKNPNISRQQKLRLGILCASCIKMSKDDYNELINEFSNEDKKILKNMIALGVSYDGSVTVSTKTITKDQQKMADERRKKTGMFLNRYTSIIELVLPLFCQILSDPLHTQSIDESVFGQIVCTVFKEENEINFKKERFAMSMIGGLSWSEVSAIRSIPDLNSVLLMADSVMTANEFLKEIGKINVISQ